MQFMVNGLAVPSGARLAVAGLQALQPGSVPADVPVSIDLQADFEHRGEDTFVTLALSTSGGLVGKVTVPATLAIFAVVNAEPAQFQEFTRLWDGVFKWAANAFAAGQSFTLTVNLWEVESDGSSIKRWLTEALTITIVAGAVPASEFRNIDFTFTVT